MPLYSSMLSVRLVLDIAVVSSCGWVESIKAKGAMPDDDLDVASLDEVREAIEQLTTEDLLRLRSFASWRMRGLGNLARGKGRKDLLQEAMVATLNTSRRKWRKGMVDFPYHLCKTMESISNGWGRRKDFGEKLETDLYPADPDQEVEDLLGSLEPTLPDQERQAIARQDLDLLRQSIADDPIATEVLSGMQEDLTGSDIKEILSISETELQSARRKIRRHAQALAQPRRDSARPKRKE